MLDAVLIAMRIGIVGAGHVGETVARLCSDAGHEVLVSNSRGPDSLTDLVAQLGPGVEAATPAEAVTNSQLVFLALPFRRREELPAADRFAGKVVVDATNPFDESGEVMDLGDDTSSERVARQLPEARLVKAFNTIHWETLRDRSRPEELPGDRLAVFVAGDDDRAKAIVADLIRDVGFEAVDTGSLREGGRLQEPEGPLFGRPMSATTARGLLDERRRE